MERRLSALHLMRLVGLITGSGDLPEGDVGLISFSRTARFDDFRVRSFGRSINDAQL